MLLNQPVPEPGCLLAALFCDTLGEALFKTSAFVPAAPRRFLPDAAFCPFILLLLDLAV